MPASDAWIEAALSITGDFETIGDPWTAVSGDFDGMGISCGPLQWNIGQGSLQPMVIGAGRAVVGKAMPLFGAEFWSACNAPISAGLSTVRGWQDGTRLRPRPMTELAALLATAEMHQQMLGKVRKVANQAFDQAALWEGTPGRCSSRAFCWFFDLVTQNGGLNGLDRDDVAAFIAGHGSERADDAVCAWLANRPTDAGHDRDCRRNAEAWKDKTTKETLDLLVISFLRAQLAKEQWRHVVMNRKGTIAMGFGWVNSERYDLAAKYPK
jgi:hypothetical protein